MNPYLLIDVSNSFTKWAWADAARISAPHRFSTPALRIRDLRALRAKNPRVQVILSSVVPAKTALLRRVFGKNVFVLSGTHCPGLRIKYRNRRQIGADRLANALAARHFYGSPAVVIDFGTAVTFDILDSTGAYCGGVIAPGLNAMTDYLHERTALLPRITVREPRRANAQSTEEAMRVGAVVGYRGLVRGILHALRNELGSPKKLFVIATGGHAELVARGFPEIQTVNPLLTLQGLHIMALRQSGAGR
jgi:type III pantothenate kinase